MRTNHYYGEPYPGPGNQKHFVLTSLHHGCGGEIVLGGSWKAPKEIFSLVRQDKPTCSKCGKEPRKREIFKDYI